MKKTVSIIFPVYNEESNLEALYDRFSHQAETFSQYQFEFIFVDDCSQDRTPDILKALHKRDQRIKVIRLAHNSGSHAATTAGLMICQGDCASVFAADLQDPPELIKDLLKEWEGGAKTIWGIRLRREGESFLTKMFSAIYYKMINCLTTINLPPDGSDLFMIDRLVIEAYKGMKEKHTSIFMALSWLGFPQSNVRYVKDTRHAGISKWTIKKKMKLMLDSLLSFSDRPIRFMTTLGMFIAFLGFCYAGVVLWGYFKGNPVEGWSSLMVVLLVIGGVQMCMLGILGEYLWRTYDESRGRPRYVVEYQLG